MRKVAPAIASAAWPLGVAAAVFTVAVGLPASDPDMWWHLASGRWIVEHRADLRIDIFSSTATGSPYALGEMWGQIVLYLAYAAGSWTGVAVLRAALIALMAFAVTRAALRFAPAGIAVPVAAVAIVLSKPTWTDRPQLFTLAFFAVLLELLLAARAGSRRPLIAGVVLVVVWSALHAGYALGLVLLWIFAVSALVERRPAAAFVAAAIAATVLVAFDPAALSFLRALDHVGTATRGIVEESPVDVLTPFGALFAIVVGATLASFLLAGADVLAALVLSAMLVLALSAQRHIPLFGIAAVPFVARSIAALLRARVRSTPKTTGPTEGPRAGGGPPDGRAPLHMKGSVHDGAPVRRVVVPPALRGFRSAPKSSALVVALWIGALASIATADNAPDLGAYPAGALPELRASSGVLLNEYDWGGYVIWNAPQRPVFVDGRLFPFLADDVLGGYRRALAVLPGWRVVIDRWGITQALLAPGRPLVQALLDEGWTVRATGPRFVLLQRPK